MKRKNQRKLKINQKAYFGAEIFKSKKHSKRVGEILSRKVDMPTSFYSLSKVGCVFSMVVVTTRSHAEFERNDQPEGASQFEGTVCRDLAIFNQ